MSQQGALEDESGITLVELTMVIILMVVVFAIASSTWFRAVESRQVVSATNQLTADLRHAHSRAINRLAPQTVTLTAGSSEYTIPGGVTDDLDDYPDQDVVSVAAARTIVFEGDGSAHFTTGANPITVRATDNTANNHPININLVTSRIKIGP
jgi:type IV fimbrial biogenesis protein FimT